MDKRDLNKLFRLRLGEAMAKNNVNQTALAGMINIDRSTLSQLLSPHSDRLPRADTLAAMANSLQVSLDWLLGLSSDNTMVADIRAEQLGITMSSGEPIEESLAAWYDEAAGYKIRYVPMSLPDLMITDAVTAHQYDYSPVKSVDRAIAENQGRLEYVRLPETDVEICMSFQTLETFTHGQAQWSDLPGIDRRTQLEHMARLTEELYPKLRLYLFDNRSCYSAPYTVFGPLRAAVYMGQMFLVFNTQEPINALSKHFDNLIRSAVIQAPDVTDYLMLQSGKVRL